MNKHSYSITFVFIAILLISCSEDETPPVPIPYFTLNVSEIYTSSAFIKDGNWIIIHDENGTVWDYATYTAGQKIVFDSIATPEKLGVTFLEVTPGVLPVAQMKTYLSVSPGEEWTIDPTPAINPGQNLGTISVNVTDSNLGDAFNSQFTNVNKKGINTSFSFSFQALITSNIRDYFLFLTNKDRKPLYRYFKNAVAGTNSLTLADFSAFDTEVSITFPETHIYQFEARGYPQGIPFDNDFGFVTSLYWDGIFNDIPASNVKLGYLNEFAAYYIVGFGYYVSTRLEYEYFGTTAPGPVNLIDDYDVTVTNKSFDNYAVSGGGYSHLTTNWSFDATTTSGDQTIVIWGVNSPKGEYKNLRALPAKITNLFPMIDFNNKSFRTTLFHKGTRTYDDVINETFKGETKKPFVRYSKIIF